MIVLKSNQLKKMPKCCKECGFMVVGDWGYGCPELGKLDFDEIICDNKRHPDCPLIDISDEDAYKLIKEETHYLTIMKALEKLKKENKDEET